MGEMLSEVAAAVRACTLCADRLPLGPRPVLRVSTTARVLIVGQAPGTKVHASGVPWNDPSGERLRAWLGIGPDLFYDEARIAILPMGLCYPGVLPNGGDMNIRSGNPDETNTASWSVAVQDATHNVTGLRLSYQYVAGYGPDGAPGGTTLSVVAMRGDACSGRGPVIATLYTSPVLSHYPFDVCETCYSPPIDVFLPAGSLNLNVSAGMQLGFIFTDNQRNVQLRLPIDATIYWSA